MYRGKMRNRIFRKIKTAQEIRESLDHISQAKEVGKAIKTRKNVPTARDDIFICRSKSWKDVYRRKKQYAKNLELKNGASRHF